MASSEFPNRLPNSRMGQKHETYESSVSAIGDQSKDLAFIGVIEESNELGRLLLGRKNRGFGNCEENTIQHYCMQILPRSIQNGACQLEPKALPEDKTPSNQANEQTKQAKGPDVAPSKYNLEQRLFHALHANQINSPTIKEFRESLAFYKVVKKHFQKHQKKKQKNSGTATGGWKVVLDVAGGHGALAALFLLSNPATQRAVCIDPSRVGNNGVTKAWGHLWKSELGDSDKDSKKELVYRNECLTIGLPSEIQKALSMTQSPEQILVVACHACQHLSEQILEISCRYGVSAAVVPCCQKDSSPGGAWKATSKALEIPLQQMMDVLLAGRIMGKGSHEVRMKCMNKQITPQNRVILARALPKDEQDESLLALQAHRSRAQVKLNIAYRRAHVLSSGYNDANWFLSVLPSPSFLHPLAYMTVGVAIGIGASHWMKKR